MTCRSCPDEGRLQHGGTHEPLRTHNFRGWREVLSAESFHERKMRGGAGKGKKKRHTSMAANSPMKKEREVSIDYLRAFVTILVLAHHSTLAYTTFAHFDTANFLRSTAPIVDSQRWAFLDYAENFNDVFFMSLMFFISGLFVWPTLRSKGVGTFLRDRLLRLGLPFVVGAALVMPLAYYPSWLAAGQRPGYLGFWLDFLKHGWSPGPLWFDLVAAVFRPDRVRHLPAPAQA